MFDGHLILNGTDENIRTHSGAYLELSRTSMMELLVVHYFCQKTPS